VRIAHTESSHGWGGQEIRVLTESQQLIEHGHEVVILADQDSLIAKRAHSYGVPVETLRLKKKRFGEIRAMIQTLNRLQPDVVSTHSSTDHWVVAIARLFTRYKPVIVRTRHVSAPIGRGLGTRWLYRSGCEAIVTTGKSIKTHLTHDDLVSEKKVFSIPTGIDLQVFRPQGKAIARDRIRTNTQIDLKKLDSSALLFGNIATLRSWKGQHDLIEAFANVAGQLPRAQLLIVGDGPQAESLRRLASQLDVAKQVLFAGHQHDVRDYFDALDIFVFPSYANEGVPQAILQAMAYGLPIITTRAGSIEEAVSGYPLVNIVKERDIAALSQSMLLAAQSGYARTNLHQELSDRISIEGMADQMIAVYERSCRNRELSSSRLRYK
jgi:glycosyltransferase involved in cell wall biosynthesis